MVLKHLIDAAPVYAQAFGRQKMNCELLLLALDVDFMVQLILSQDFTLIPHVFILQLHRQAKTLGTY